MTNSQTKERLRVLHVISGDLWAGAEAQAYTLLKHLKPLCDVHAVLMNDGELAERLRACDIPVTVFDESRLSTWQIFQSLRMVMKHIAPHVVHTHRQKENILGSIANSTTIKAKCVRTVHGAPEFHGGFATRFKNYLDTLTGRKLQDKIVAVSNELKEKLNPYFDEKNIEVIFNEVDAHELKTKANEPISNALDPNKINIGIIGRLVEVKRVDLFIKIANQVNLKHPDRYCFHVVGDGPLRTTLEEQVSEIGKVDFIKFHGHVSNTAPYVQAMNAVILCSVHEGMPMISLEAAALNTPLITHIRQLSSNSALRNLVLIESDLPEKFIEAIVGLPARKQERSDAPRNAIQMQKNYFKEIYT